MKNCDLQNIRDYYYNFSYDTFNVWAAYLG